MAGFGTKPGGADAKAATRGAEAEAALSNREPTLVEIEEATLYSAISWRSSASSTPRSMDRLVIELERSSEAGRQPYGEVETDPRRSGGRRSARRREHHAEALRAITPAENNHEGRSMRLPEPSAPTTVAILREQYGPRVIILSTA